MASEQAHKILELPSEHASLEVIVETVEQYGATHELGEDLTYRLLMVSTEAATNAIRHGNQFDEQKPIIVELSLSESQVELWVRDKGVGFDRSAVADPLEPDNMLEDSGRGLFLIEQMADEVSYEDDGRTMHARFSRPDGDGRA